MAAALLAALLPLLAGLANAFVYNDAPRAVLLDSLGRAVEPGPIGKLPSLHIELYEFFEEQSALLLAIAAANAIGLVCAGLALAYLGAATRARRPEFQRWAVYLPVLGAVLFALAGLIVTAGTARVVEEALSGPRTVESIAGLDTSLVNAGELMERAGRFLLGIGFVLVCLNAMRTGLLFRFLGILGVIAGGLLAVPVFGGPLPIVQSFWFVALAIVVSGRWPDATPPAWTSGKAEPWLTQQELKEAREIEAQEDVSRPRKRNRGPGRQPSADASRSATRSEPSKGSGGQGARSGGTEATAGAARPAPSKRKRKRRR